MDLTENIRASLTSRLRSLKCELLEFKYQIESRNKMSVGMSKMLEI